MVVFRLIFHQTHHAFGLRSSFQRLIVVSQIATIDIL
jgi:hypothetical protein